MLLGDVPRLGDISAVVAAAAVAVELLGFEWPLKLSNMYLPNYCSGTVCH